MTMEARDPMTELAAINEEIARLERRKAQLQGEARAQAVAKIRDIMLVSGLSSQDVMAMAKGKKPSLVGTAAEPVYRHPDGRQWTGRGRMPEWVKGRQSEYRIAA
jgi:DNA-binding protein H-NS